MPVRPKETEQQPNLYPVGRTRVAIRTRAAATKNTNRTMYTKIVGVCPIEDELPGHHPRRHKWRSRVG